MELTAENVHRIFLDCLFQPEEPTSNAIVAEGVKNYAGFHPGRLTEHANDIADLLSQLPDSFQATSGGGMSFLNACVTKDGQQWGEHQNVDELLCLGLASGQADYLMPKPFWRIFPGGMPYFLVRKK